MSSELIITGAGPAGLFTAIQAAKKNKDKKIIILEKNNQAGKKLLLSGSGQCNLTHAGDISNFFDHYGDNHNFLLGPLYSFDNKNLMSFFNKREIKFRKARGGKIFPKSNKAEDILETLLQECKNKNIKIIYNSPVKKVEYNQQKKIFEINTPTKNFNSKFFVIATGGKSFPKTGSTGDGFKIARNLGHSISRVKAALAPVIINNHSFKMLSGISMHSKELSLWRNNSLVKRWTGDLLITHKGLSGPAIINYSRYMEAGDIIKIKLLDHNRESLKKDILKKINREGKLNIKNLLIRYPIAQRLIEKILENLNINGSKNAAHLNKKERNKIIDQFLSLEFKIKKIADFNQSMVTKGGISLKEINPGTMESEIINNLFAVGEVLDIDGDTGGYNLQAAFSTAYAAGTEIAERL